MSGLGKQLNEFWRRFSALVAGKVDDGMSVCEFECRESQCTLGDWEHCENRRRALGESRRSEAR